MPKPRPDHEPPPGGLPPDPDEVGPTVRDIAYNLAHRLSDTPGDLRDAAAAAPLVAMKLAQRLAGAVMRRPGRALAALATILLATNRLARRRRPRRT